MLDRKRGRPAAPSRPRPCPAERCARAKPPPESARMWPSSRPGINDGIWQIGTMSRIAGRQTGVLGEHDAGDHGVAEVAWTAGLLARGHKDGGMFRRRAIKLQNAVIQPVEDD